MALGQLARVLPPGGRLVVLEFAVPERGLLRVPYLFYFRRLLPWIGAIVSPRGSAYSYLPESVLGFPQRRGFLDRLAASRLRRAVLDRPRRRRGLHLSRHDPPMTRSR